MGWCNDPHNKKYNSLVKINEKLRHERLYRIDNKYDIFVVINYNLKKPIPFKGSAIFLHISKPNFEGTEGCVAIEKKNIIELAKKIDVTTKLIIKD